MAVLIFYDIEDNRKRERIAKMLLKAGLTRIQYSVFLGDLRTENMVLLIARLKARWKDAPPGDKLYTMAVQDDDVINSRALGTVPDWEMLLGKVKCRVY